MFCTGEIGTRNQGVSIFFSVLFHICDGSVLCNKLAELVVGIVVSFLAELYRTFHDSYFVFVLVSLLVHYLQNQVRLSNLQVGNVLNRLVNQGIDELTVFSIQFCSFPASGTYPGCFTSLTVLLGQFREIGSVFQRSVDTVSQSLGLGFVFSIDLNLTELDRIWGSYFSDNLERIVRVVCLIVIRTINFIDGCRIQTGSYIAR